MSTTTTLPTPVTRPSKRKQCKFWRKQYGINVKTMHFIYAQGMLPKHPSFMAAKLLVKGFSEAMAPFKSKREVAMQRLYALLAPDMATPMSRQRDENGKAKHVVIMRWIKGVTPTVAHGTGHDIIPSDLQKKEYGAMKLLDMLTNNSDRHGGNYVYSKEHLHPIDHEMSFYDPMPPHNRMEYTLRNMNHAHLRGALWMLDNIRKNTWQVARWLRLGYYCEPVHDKNKRDFSAKRVAEWVDNVRPCVIACLKKRENNEAREW